jgi:flagellar motor switch protein FliM
MADSIWTQAMNEHIKEATSTLTVKLGEAEMTVGDLITLDRGDIIPLNQEASGEVSLMVEGVEKMKCLIGVHKGNRAVQITDVVETEEKEG